MGLRVHEFFPEFNFRARGGALEHEWIEGLDLFGATPSAIDFWPLRERAGLLNGERAVHEKKSLLRHGRMKSNLAAGVRIGEVERAKDTGQVLAVNQAVERSPR